MVENPANATAFHIFFGQRVGSRANRSHGAGEAPILGGDYRVLEIGRDLLSGMNSA